MTDFPDRKLVFEVVTKHDQDSFRALYRQYDQELYRFLLRRLPQKEDVEDVVAQTFLKAWEYLISESGKKVFYFRGLIYKIAKNEIADWYRKQGKMPPTIALDKPGQYGDYLDVPDERKDLFLSQLRKQDLNYLIDCVQKLKEPYREAVALRFFEELHINEIAEVLEKSAGNTRVLIHRGIKALKQIMLENKQELDTQL